MRKKQLEASHYIEELARNIRSSKAFFASLEKREVNSFPDKPGVYIILRATSFEENGYKTKTLNTKIPLVLYVGKTTARRSIKKRLTDHFGGKSFSYQGSQFRKFLMQVCQDEQVVKDILWSPNTLIACVEINEGDEVIDAVEKLAMRVFSPRFNLKDY